jgi:outer membrane protein assembly complex protein YaeT
MTRTHGTKAATAPAWDRLLVVAGLLAAALAAQAARGQAPEAATVEDVRIDGLRTIVQEQLKPSLRTQTGQPYSDANVQEDIKSLAAKKTFKTPFARLEQLGPRSVRVVFVAEEYPNTVREVIYKNAHHARPDDLDGITKIKRGLPLSPRDNLQACKDIVDYYKREGRYFASCVLEEGGNPGDTRVVFNITEGPIVRMRYIRFTGNSELASSARLRTQIDTMQRFLVFQMISSKYNPRAVEEDANKLEDYYKANGYLDARVTREVTFTDDHQFVDVTYHITEGQRYHVGDVVVKGTAVLSKDQVEEILRVKKGDLYDAHIIEQDVRNITDLYGWRGYPAAVQPVLVYSKDQVQDPGVVRVQYEIVERTPFKVGEIYIAGNDITKNRVIYRMLSIYPGQTLSYPALRMGEKDLARSNLFDQEERPTITPIERDDSFNSEYKDILVRVKETMTGSLMFGASVNSDAGLVGSIVLNERNFDILRPPTSIDDILEGRAFRGGGQEFRIEAVPGTQVQRYSVSFREPFLFDLPYSLSTQAYYFDRSYVEDLETRYGLNVSLGHQINRNWSVSVGLRLENVRIGSVPFYAPEDYLSVQGDNLVVAPRITIARDDRDSYLRPTEGGLLSFTYEQLLGDFTSPILTAQASRFFTVHQRPDGSGRHVIMVRSQLSWAGDETPVFERFYAGGIQSMRGFEYRGVGPMVNGFNVGGDFMFLNSVEYQVPVVANDQIYLVAFLDSGTIERSVEIRDYRVSAGVGARIVVPMLGQVPIALDFGFPIVRAATDRTQMFSFYVGFFK